MFKDIIGGLRIIDGRIHTNNNRFLYAADVFLSTVCFLVYETAHFLAILPYNIRHKILYVAFGLAEAGFLESEEVRYGIGFCGAVQPRCRH